MHSGGDYYYFLPYSSRMPTASVQTHIPYKLDGTGYIRCDKNATRKHKSLRLTDNVLTHTVSHPGTRHFIISSPCWISSSVIVTPQLHALRSRTRAFLTRRPRVLIVPSIKLSSGSEGRAPASAKMLAAVVSEPLTSGLLGTRGMGLGLGTRVGESVGEYAAADAGADRG